MRMRCDDGVQLCNTAVGQVVDHGITRRRVSAVNENGTAAADNQRCIALTDINKVNGGGMLPGRNDLRRVRRRDF